MKVQYSPTLFLNSNNETEWKTLHNEYLEPMKFENIREAKDFVERYKEVSNFKIYGNSSFNYAFIAEQFPGQVDWDIEQLKISVIDIEVGSENGFPNPNTASEPITAICITDYITRKSIVYGCGDYDNQNDNVTYIKCRDEYTLCKKFIEYWYNDTPDVVTGWNVKFFDIPYLHNRISRILTEEDAKKLSPWNFVNQRKMVMKGKEQIAYEISGVSCLDYIELYKWYAPNGKSQESYRLDHIANVELGESKLSYDEYDNLHKLLSTKSRDIKVPENKAVSDMKEFEKWCYLRDKIKKELDSRK